MDLTNHPTLLKRYCSATGTTKPKCPKCNAPFPKMPGRATVCKVCKTKVTLRTRPLDKKRVLVTVEDAAKLDAERARVSGWNAVARMVGPTGIDEQRDALLTSLVASEKWSIDPHEVLSGFVLSQIQKAAREKVWGVYYCESLPLGLIEAHRERYATALDIFLELAYVSLNGPTNQSGTGKYPAFRPDRDGILPELVVEKSVTCITSLNASRSAVQAAFKSAAVRFATRANPPLSPDHCWVTACAAIRERIDFDAFPNLRDAW